MVRGKSFSAGSLFRLTAYKLEHGGDQSRPKVPLECRSRIKDAFSPLRLEVAQDKFCP
jgi:hypothetical protein